MLHLAVGGANGIVSVFTAPVLFVTFDVAVVSVDDFFDTRIVDNLAAFFGISPDKIRFVDVVSESSGRRKREYVFTTYEKDIESSQWSTCIKIFQLLVNVVMQLTCGPRMYCLSLSGVISCLAPFYREIHLFVIKFCFVFQIHQNYIIIYCFILCTVLGLSL